MPRLTIDQAMQIAIASHQAGRLTEAEAIYRQILAQLPDHADSLHLLGVLECQAGHTAAAIDLIGRAIAINGNVADYHSNLGESYRRAERWDEAIASLRRAISLKPDSAAAHNNLGVILKQQGKPDQAIAAYKRAIQINPDFAEAYSNLGNACRDMRRFDEAISACNRAIALRPEYAEAHNNLGNALRDHHRSDEALATYQRAVALKPEYAEAHNNLGSALWDLGRIDEAVAACNRAIELKPGFAEAYSGLGIALWTLGRHDEAMAAYHRAVALKPDYAEVHDYLGTAWKDKDRFDEAIAAYRHAIALNPDFAEAHNNLGNVFRDQGRLDEALACYRRATELKPDSPKSLSNLLCTLHFHPSFDAPAILEQHRRWARLYAEDLTVQIGFHTNDPTPERRLRVGFVSPDFRDHPVGRLLLPLFSHLDRRQTEIVGYGDVRVADGVTEQFKVLTDQWHTIVGMSDPEVADRIRDDQIDILVDLALHTAGNRLLVFARKPAPVQVTMFGMPATTGLATIDYRLTDRYLDPPGASDGDYTEQSIRLPHCFWCYQPPEEAPAIGELPARKNGFVTFGCLNQFAKVSRPALEVWVKILQSLPTSRLVIQSQPGSHLDAVRRGFQEGGIALDRVEFAAKVPRDQYFHRYRDLDLGLDPFPYNGHTSTLDSLWMGVPVITLVGRTAVGRGGLSLLSNLGLPELIAGTARQYVEIAVETAGDLDRLSELRASLRPRLSSSALMDGPQYAADVSAAFRRMWETWCSRKDKSLPM